MFDNFMQEEFLAKQDKHIEILLSSHWEDSEWSFPVSASQWAEKGMEKTGGDAVLRQLRGGRVKE
jgi:hypothetical protein